MPHKSVVKLYLLGDLRTLLSAEHLHSIVQACQACDVHMVEESPQNLGDQVQAGDFVFGSKGSPYFLRGGPCLPPGTHGFIWHHRHDPVVVSADTHRVEALRFAFGENPPALTTLLLRYALKTLQTHTPAGGLLSHFSACPGLHLTLSNSKDRPQLKDHVGQFFQGFVDSKQYALTTGVERHIKHMLDVLEELMMNAIWDANAQYATHDRTQPIALGLAEQVHVSCYFDGQHFIVSVKDLFGAFAPEALARQMLFTLNGDQQYSPSEGSAGAGIGMLMSLKKIDALVLEVAPHRSTQATAIICANQSVRDMQRRTRSLLFYWDETGSLT